MLKEDKQWDNQGARHVVHLHGVAEGYVTSSQSLTKYGPLDKEWQTTSVFLPQEPHEHNEKEKYMTPEDERPGW